MRALLLVGVGGALAAGPASACTPPPGFGAHQRIESTHFIVLNLLGPYGDDASGRAAVKTRHVELLPRNFGEFKVPGLRDVARTAPYMHDGSLADLRAVVRHYSDLDPERIHADGERILVPLALTPGEVDDLVAFLESLTDPRPAAIRREPVPCPAARPAP